MTIPNILTLARILLIPLIVIFLLANQLGKALAVFMVAGVTDGLDGFIARMFHQKSKLGAYLDPLADKLLLVTTFLLMAHLDLLPMWLVVIVVSRDFLIILGVITFTFHSVKFDINPSIISKLTTLMQIILVIMGLLTPLFHLKNIWLFALSVFTALITVASGSHYLLMGVRIWESSRNADQDKG